MLKIPGVYYSPSQSSFFSPYVELPNTNTTATVEYKVKGFMVKF
jgi:hypothetical protein